MFEETEENDSRTELQNRLFNSGEYLVVVTTEVNRVLAADTSEDAKVICGRDERWLAVADFGGFLMVDLGFFRP
ncbi:hypothetical protein R6Q59_013819 [Mikania micrantha]